jgi:hypothetical protein
LALHLHFFLAGFADRVPEPVQTLGDPLHGAGQVIQFIQDGAYHHEALTC